MQLGRLKFRGDQYIWFAVILLSLLGLLAVYSATGSLAFKKQQGNTEYFAIRHVMFLFGGFFLMYFFHLRLCHAEPAWSSPHAGKRSLSFTLDLPPCPSAVSNHSRVGPLASVILSRMRRARVSLPC